MNELLDTLNPHQKAYVKLDLENPKNGEYLLAVFRCRAKDGLNLLQVAAEVAAESSTGTNFLVSTETSFSKTMNALVYKVDVEKELIWIAYPWRLFDRGGNIQNILTYVV
jgi:ribulose-bisphosphate carboxylase large chain